MDAASDDELVKIRRRVESHPTDLQARFELGVALCSRHDYVAAMPELQRAMASPPVRFRAMALLADVFDSRGMTESAARVRQRISEESGDEGDSGSAPLPVPTRPFTPHDSSGARKVPNEDDPAA
jgi:Tfp pilus assembly protein PilF